MDIEGLKEQLRRCHLRTGLEVVEEAADAIEQLQQKNEKLRSLWANAEANHSALSDDYAKLQRELEEARKDAERWKQWKQWWSNTSDDEWHLPESVVVALDDLDIDDAMDAAREKQG